jgi:hypothetical protein
MVHIDETIVVTSAADLRTNPTHAHKTAVVLLTGLTKTLLADNGVTVIRPTGVTKGAWVRLSKYQDTVHIEQNGPVVNGSFSRLVARGGYYGSFFARLGTAGSTASTVGIAVDGVTVATVSFAANALVGTIAFVVGTSFAAINGSKFTFVISAGTNAADLTVVLDV